MKNKKTIVGIVFLGCLLIGAVIMLNQIIWKNNDRAIDNPKEKATTESVMDKDLDVGEGSTETNQGEMQEETRTAESNPTTEEATTKVPEVPTEKNTTTSTESTSDENTEEEKVQKIKFPYQIPNTDIVIQSLKSYEGKFLEDGSDEELDNVVAIELKNNSAKTIEYGNIVIKAGKTELEFHVSLLPAKSSVIVQEISKNKFKSSWKYEMEKADFAYLSELDLLEDEVKISAGENNSITVTNISGKKIPVLRLFYKYCLDSGEYVGGIAYTSKIEGLEKEESITIKPSHFVSNGSRILMVRKYNQ